jgi:hypothetical protein
MTSQTKKFIELSDILTLQFECKNATCKATLTLSVSQELRKQTLFACPACKQPWALVNGGECESTIRDFLSAFGKLQHTLNSKPDSFPAGFLLRLEIREEIKPEQKLS